MTTTNKDAKYYADLLLNVARTEYADVENLEENLNSVIDCYSEALKEYVEQANEKDPNAWQENEHRFARYLIVWGMLTNG